MLFKRVYEVFIILIFVLLVSTISYAFTFNSLKIVDNNNRPSIFIEFETEYDIYAKIIGPDGIKTDEEYIEASEYGTYLELAGFYATPKLGNYKLLIEKGWTNQVIYSRTLYFKGANATITKINLKWDYNDERVAGIPLVYINITIKNSGDLPTYLYGGDIVIGNEEGVISTPFNPVIMPNQTKKFTLRPFMVVPSGNHSLNITLVDSQGSIICTYKGYVTISVVR